MTFKNLGAVDNQIVEKFDKLVARYNKTTDQEALDTIAYGICEEVSEIREVITRLDKKYSVMEEHGEKAAEMSQKKGGEAKRLQNRVNELLRQNGDLKRRLKQNGRVHR